MPSHRASGSPKRWRAIEQAIAVFRAAYLHPTFQSIQIFEGYDPALDDDGYKKSRALRPYHKRGVYLIFDQRSRLIYVGSTIRSFDTRIWRYGLPDQGRIDLICFDDKHLHFAPALELFLIARCKPRYNSVGARLEF